MIYTKLRLYKHWYSIKKTGGPDKNELQKSDLEIYFMRVTNTSVAEDLPNILLFDKPVKYSPLQEIKRPEQFIEEWDILQDERINNNPLISIYH